MARLLIEKGWVIPIHGRREVIEEGAVAIQDDRIVLEDGKVLTVDEAEALRQCQKRAEGVWHRARALLEG